MHPAGVVLPDVAEEAGFGLLSGEWAALGVDLLVLERGEPGLHDCVVVAALAFTDRDVESGALSSQSQAVNW